MHTNTCPPSPVSVVCSGVQLGGAIVANWRSSHHSYTGAVCVVAFRTYQQAQAFRARWSDRCGAGFCAIRGNPGAGWCVSVPVSQRPTAGSVVLALSGPSCGGVRRVAATLSTWSAQCG